MFTFFVYTETEVTEAELVHFVQSRGGKLDHESLLRGSYTLEDKQKGLAVYLSLCKDPEVPGRLKAISEETGKPIFSGVCVSVGKRSYEFAISVASLMIRTWGGLADLDDVAPETLKLAEHHNLPLWSDREV